MTESTPSPSATPRTAEATSWVLARLTEDTGHRRTRSIAVVAATVALIGWVDYASGIWFSLTLFYLIPIAFSLARLGWLAGCVTATACLTVRMSGDWIAGIYSSVPPTIVNLNRLFDLSVYLLFIWIFHSFISLRRQLEQRVRQRTAALEESVIGRQRLERELLDIAARERNAIGRELHDDLCQHLVGTAFAAKVLDEHLVRHDATAAHDAQSIVGYVEEGIAKTRGLARGLLLASIEPANLPGELANLAAKGSEGGVPCRFRMEGRPVIDDAAAAQLFRIAQEALRNALRHSVPKRVDIVLTGNDEATFLMINDDGSGQPPDDSSTGLGLRIMEHRAALIGGILSIIPAPGEGTRVICRIPQPSLAAVP